MSETNGHNSEHDSFSPKFRGTFAPAEMHYLMHDGKITPTEFALLQIIDSLVDAKGEGCWASNTTLAGKIHRSREHIRTMIRHLKKLGLVKQIGVKVVNYQEYRVLETKWSRVQIEVGGGVTDNPPTLVTDNPPTLVTDNPHINKDVDRKRTRINPHGRQNGDGGIPKSVSNGKHSKPVELILSEKLFAASQKINKLSEANTPSPECTAEEIVGRWSKEIAKLWKRGKFSVQTVEKVMEKHLRHIGEQMWPHAYCASVFVSKFEQISDSKEDQPKKVKNRRSSESNRVNGFSEEEMYIPEDQQC